MNQNNTIAQTIYELGKESFSKLETLSIPPYPKYYYDTFMEFLNDSSDPELIDLSKKHSYLFSLSQESAIGSACFDLAKKGLEEYIQTNNNLKAISDESFIDINNLQKEPSKIQMGEIISAFGSFQGKILNELKNADDTVTKLKLEVERLERESNIDPLTKTHNRRVLTKDLEEILSFGEDKAIDMQLVMFDADDFKKINDSFGHIAGDKTLIFIAKLIQNSIRRGTRVYRYGGEEFIVILNRTSFEEAEKTVGRIIQETSDSKLLYKGHSIHLTLSAGLASHEKGISAEALLEKVDKALYDAKKNGKNCYKVIK
ncbi:MAG: GGDEF domain-containing protein [Sulfurospirillaceae bacterium]|nr:GGDEF domain-containing protein [Sulfurospirillaceae bacterium]MDD3462391.1 GGDEF domain-containing protein [Sulfurospirillaceae bacterium]